MKILLTFSVLTLMSFTTEAQTNSSRTITLEPILETKQKPRSSRKRRVFQLTLETETMTVRDRNNDITGSTTYYQAEPQLNITDRFNARLGMAYFDRFAGGSYKGREDKKRRDCMEGDGEYVRTRARMWSLKTQLLVSFVHPFRSNGDR